jgi:glucose/arabinose dehydrogenase
MFAIASASIAALEFAGIVSAAPAAIELTLLERGLVVPTTIATAGDGTGRLFIAEKAGTVRIFDGDELLAADFLDIQSLVATVSEQGLIGLAFHPDYQTNGFFYVHYSRLSDGDSVIARYRVSAGDPNDADEASHLRLLRVNQNTNKENHNGGDIHFGPDGLLYIALGDDGGIGDPLGNAQDPSTLSGSLLRIDVDNPDAGREYGIPASNPFAANASARGEIWAYGLRNPWRFSFDRQNGDVFISDVGQGEREEINLQPSASAGGENYGWNCLEGTLDFDFVPSCASAVLTPPELEYDHAPAKCGDGGSGSITGGYRYRGSLWPPLDGTYLYADYCTGKFYQALETAPGAWSATSSQVLPSVTTFGEDDDGEIYLADISGDLYALPEPGRAEAGLAALVTLGLVARAERRRAARPRREA